MEPGGPKITKEGMSTTTHAYGKDDDYPHAQHYDNMFLLTSGVVYAKFNTRIYASMIGVC